MKHSTAGEETSPLRGLFSQTLGQYRNQCKCGHLKTMSDIRLAQPDDAEAIHRILQETWGESLLFDVFMDHISSSEHQVFVAVEFSEVVSFLSAFLVSSSTPHWEIDLIIVRSASQGKGIGTSLIEEALVYGSNLGVDWAKASIRIDNYASQHTFSKVGFTTDAQVRSLFIWDPLFCEFSTDVAENVRLIPVNTLLYRGLWIDGFFESQLSLKEQHDVIRTARNSIFHENRLNTGMFIPDSFKRTLAPDLLTTATNFGQYHRWEYPFK
ncbi:GNAT family N-acetyltransferase [Candidatus Poribacteria bacterium]|nr:GNAT family N-acetyltransferase [Candidatus Poribacteria bacterium]MYB63566.1 GNAT family N-acetyltransferase [Candidatus Poribacteria bacterium]MYF56541.1 GNAT family N-acetyltransferase [Candidatus Poribacteria bacterium]